MPSSSLSLSATSLRILTSSATFLVQQLGLAFPSLLGTFTMLTLVVESCACDLLVGMGPSRVLVAGCSPASAALAWCRCAAPSSSSAVALRNR